MELCAFRLVRGSGAIERARLGIPELAFLWLAVGRSGRCAFIIRRHRESFARETEMSARRGALNPSAPAV
jgi:hypothetical protein